ncbi:MAG: hypothetical protein QOJ65_2269 [Fimbriimonadaceae bacterium]|jgi:pyruvate/2-oxoglutarate dehydrogenase complex dihydrolipoamide acyltransferase (E2) component|nr:hypothetical protein [Fimbriimonadaceae bacterium]
MPELGESVHEGTVSRWLKKEGDLVKEDEPVVEIMTDKVNTELPAPATGVLTKILIPEGGQVEVFAPMGIIEEQGSAAVAASKPAEEKKPKDEPKPAAEPAKAPAPAAMQPSASAMDGGRRWYTPVVRSIAKKNNVTEAELAAISGSGGSGRVTKRDLESYLASGKTGAAPRIEAKPAAPVVAGPDQEVVKLVGMRKMIAEAMVRAAQVPVVTTVTQADVTAMVQFRDANKDAFQQQNGVKLTYTPFFIKAITETLLEFPMVNSSLQGDTIVVNKVVHMGVAVALGAKGDEGLIVPVIRNCERKNLVDLAKELDKIAKKARSNQLSVEDVQGGTFTLTNPGTYGALFGTPMINAPQAGIMGAYAIKKVPEIINDMIGIRSVMHLVLTYDHRIVDGLVAGRFLAAARDRLEKFDFFK